MKVHEIMTAHARTIRADNTLVEAAGLMRELDVGALPVWQDDALAGMVTDRDIVVRAVADGADPNTAPVSQVMSGAAQHVFADDDVEQAARIMEKHQIRRLPVLDRQKRLVGIVSLGDIATSSNPAFSGMALRDVSVPNVPSARRRRLHQQSEPVSMPAVAGARRGPEAQRMGGMQKSRRAVESESSRGAGRRSRRNAGAGAKSRRQGSTKKSAKRSKR